jgi:hypothetical protein
MEQEMVTQPGNLSVRKIGAVVAGAFVLLCSNRVNALVIDPTFDSSITSSSNVIEIEGALRLTMLGTGKAICR